ncbi:MAG: hypothetical protein IH892_10155 [Planctomycetes bacterium]|nr:hypothetical protein [Planctomycetota bacterium]
MREWIKRLIIGVSLFAAAAGGAEDPFNVDCFFGWGGRYRPMEWTSVEVGITSQLKEPFGGTLHVSVPQDEMNRLNIAHSFAVAPDLPMRLPMVTKIAFGADTCNLRITDERGKTAWRRRHNLYDYSALKPINRNDLLIGLVGKRAFGLFRLPKETLCIGPKVYNEERGTVYLEHKLPRVVPWDWTGFVSLDCLILYDVDLSQFRPEQLSAISQWVSNGGRLLLVLGGRPVDAGNALGTFLPFTLQSPQEVTLSPIQLGNLGLKTHPPASVTCQFPRARPHAFAEQEGMVTDEDALYTIAMAGFGRVGVLAFDPDTLPSDHKGSTAPFWTKLISQLMEAPKSLQSSNDRDPQRTIELASTDVDEAQDNPSRRYGQFELAGSQEMTNRVLTHLHSIDEMRPLSIWWIILLLSLLAILLGPVDYMVLKRLGKLPWTWVTCAFWIALFTGGAYYGVQYLRAGDLQYRSVSVIDGIAENPLAWQTTYSGIFAPRSDRYALAGLEGNQWWSAAFPTQQRLYRRQTRGTREVDCVQQDGGNLPYAVPINIWTMQCLLTESVVSDLPFSARVSVTGRDLEVTVDNRSDHAIRNLFVLFGSSRSRVLGGVPAEQAETLTGRLASGRRGRAMTLTQEQIFGAGAVAPRTRGIQHYLDRGAAVVCVEYDAMPLPWTMTASECQYDPIQLARLVVFPEKTEDQTHD